MKTVDFIIEQCSQTKLLVGYIPGVAGAHSQGQSVEALVGNLKEVCELLEFSGVQLVGKFDGSTYQLQV